jgi:hypothetical protein
MAVERRKEVITQLTMTALSPKLWVMAGRAMLMEEIRKVPINEVTITTVISDICLLFHSIPYPNLHGSPKIIQMLSVVIC